MDARWGYSHTKGWIFGYKLHVVSSTDSSSIIVPLVADITTANVSDKPVYPDLISCLSLETLKKNTFCSCRPRL
jgi:Transposase DDE domain